MNTILLFASLLLLAFCLVMLVWIACDRPPPLAVLAYVALRLSGLTAPLLSLASHLRPPTIAGGASARSARSSTTTAAASAPTVPSPSQSPLYTHVPHPHVPRSANDRHQEAIASGGLSQRLAVWITNHIGTMSCAFVFAGIGIGSLVGIFTGNVILASVCGSFSSYFLQLVLLPLLSIGQNVASDHQSLQADEQYKATVRTLHENDQHRQHLDAQDSALVGIAHKLDALLTILSPQTGAVSPVAPASDHDPADTTLAAPVPTAAGRARRSPRTKAASKPATD